MNNNFFEISTAGIINIEKADISPIDKFISKHKYCKNMNKYVKKNKIKNYGLDDEVEDLIKGLSRLKKNNVLIIGKAGIGKTALVEKLCELINDGKVPDTLKNKTIIEVSLGGCLAGSKYRGDFEEKIQELVIFVTDRDDIILFIDEIHNIIGSGKAEGAIGAGDLLKPYLARGEFSLIGATTMREYEMSIAKEPALNRRFFKLSMEEPGTDKVIHILQKAKIEYEKHYGIKLTKKDIDNIIELSNNREGSFPDKAFDELEDYCYKKMKEG